MELQIQFLICHYKWFGFNCSWNNSHFLFSFFEWTHIKFQFEVLILELEFNWSFIKYLNWHFNLFFIDSFTQFENNSFLFISFNYHLEFYLVFIFKLTIKHLDKFHFTWALLMIAVVLFLEGVVEASYSLLG